jgi:hypothetical protein
MPDEWRPQNVKRVKQKNAVLPNVSHFPEIVRQNAAIRCRFDAI